MRDILTPWAADDIDKLRYNFNAKAVGALMRSLILGTAVLMQEERSCSKCGYHRCGCNRKAKPVSKKEHAKSAAPVCKTDTRAPRFYSDELGEWISWGSGGWHSRYVTSGRNKDLPAMHVCVRDDGKIERACYRNASDFWVDVPITADATVGSLKRRLDAEVERPVVEADPDTLDYAAVDHIVRYNYRDMPAITMTLVITEGLKGWSTSVPRPGVRSYARDHAHGRVAAIRTDAIGRVLSAHLIVGGHPRPLALPMYPVNLATMMSVIDVLIARIHIFQAYDRGERHITYPEDKTNYWSDSGDFAVLCCGPDPDNGVAEVDGSIVTLQQDDREDNWCEYEHNLNDLKLAKILAEQCILG